MSENCLRIPEEPVVPNLEQVTRTFWLDLPDELFGGRNFNPNDFSYLLKRLELGLYRAPDATYWIGLPHTDVHDHDRWVLHTVTGEPDGWRVPKLNRARNEKFTAGEGLLDHLNQHEQRVAYINQRRSMINRRALTPTQVITYANLLDARWYEASVWMPDLAEANLVDLHELIHHQDTWRIHNSEGADIPQALLLRMRGLGEVLDLLNREV